MKLQLASSGAVNRRQQDTRGGCRKIVPVLGAISNENDLREMAGDAGPGVHRDGTRLLDRKN